MANHIENLSQFLQSFGVAALALLFLPVLIAALTRNVALALAASLLSFPVAAFLSLAVLTIVLSAGTLAGAVEEGAA